MKKHKTAVYLFWILMTEAVGGLAGWLIKDGVSYYKSQVNKPVFSPPSVVFPIVWALLYGLMGIGVSRVVLSPGSKARTDGIQLYLIQLAVNFAWSIVFFNLRVYGAALAVLLLLLVLILWMILRFRAADRIAAGLQIPYAVWVLFAAFLNAGVLLLNP